MATDTEVLEAVAHANEGGQNAVNEACITLRRHAEGMLDELRRYRQAERVQRSALESVVEGGGDAVRDCAHALEVAHVLLEGLS